AVLLVIRAEAALAGVMVEASDLCPLVESAHGIGGEGAIAHRRDVEDGGGVGLRAVAAADRDAKEFFRRHRGGRGMLQPFEAALVNVVFRAERPLVERMLGPLVDDGALTARERQAVLVVLEKILPHLRPYLLEQESKVGRDGVVAQDRMPALKKIAQSEEGEKTEENQRDGQQRGLRGKPPQQQNASRQAGKSGAQ